MKTLLATPGGSSSLLATHPGVSEAYVLGLRLWLLELGLRGLNSCELDIERLKHLRKVKARDRGSREELSRRIAEAVAERKRRLQIVQNSMLKIETFPDPQISVSPICSTRSDLQCSRLTLCTTLRTMVIVEWMRNNDRLHMEYSYGTSVDCRTPYTICANLSVDQKKPDFGQILQKI